MNNVIPVRFLNSRVATAPSQWQFDYGQILDVQGIDDLPSVFEAHFANAGAASTITQIGTDGQVSIPDQCFLNGKRIDVYIYLHTGADDGETEYHIIIPVNARPQPSDTPPTPVQQDAITQAIAALNDAVTQTGDDVTAASGYADAAEASAVRAEEAAASIDEEMIANAVEDYLDEHPVTVDETDPTVPSWAKQPTKPSYTASEIGAVPVEAGKGLSTNDYTTAEKQKLAGIEAGADKTPDLSGFATKTELNGKVDKVSGKGLSTNDYTTAEKTKLAGIETGAQKNPDLSHYVTDSDYNPSSKTSDQTQAVGVDANGKLWTAPGSSITVDSTLSDSSTNPVQNKVIKEALDGKGTYSKPSGGIPDSDIASAGTWNAKGTYSKPSGGIPKTDLASAVQTSLGKADTALQEVPSTYRTAAAQDTIDSGKIDKPSNPSSGAFLVWNGSAWVAQTLATWQGGSF